MDKLLQNLNKQQVEAIKHTFGPLLIVAGAGTGKTTVITRRIAYLVEQKLAKPDEIAALTFTEKAAAEMQERVDLLLPLGHYDTWISTFHSFCERILKNHGLDIGLPNDFTLLDGIQQWILVYKNFEKFNLDYYRPLGNPARFIDSLLSHFSRCKDELITPESYLEYAQKMRLQQDSPEKAKKKKNKKVEPDGAEEIDELEISRLEEVANAYHVYQKLLLDNNYLDFGDLINYALNLFQKRPKILAHYKNKLKFVMVDEFQDTNYAQYQLVKLLSSGDQNLVVVGDDDQSIYKFRGASVSNILKFQEEYPKLKQITLTQNYRSSQNILDLAYGFIQSNNPDRLEKKLKIEKKLISQSKNKGVIEVLEGEDLSQELDLVVKKILSLKTPGNSWNDFAVLLRRNASANELLPILESSEIPYTFVANTGLYKKPIIVDLLSYLRLLDNAHDSLSLYRVLGLPKFKLEHQDAASLLQLTQKKTLSLYEAMLAAQISLSISQPAKKKISALVEYLNKHTQQAKTKNAGEIFVEIIRELGVDQKIKDDTSENVQSRELIEQFYKKIEVFQQQNADKSLHHFLYTLNLELEAGYEGAIKFDPNLGPESLKVMTIHSAKGLEFKYVFIISLVDQRFPTREKAESIEIPKDLIKDILPEGDFHLQEERRLFYVAMTRAKEGLFLSWAKDYGGAKLKKPSIFLIETNLVPSEKVSKATGKVIFTRPKRDTEKEPRTVSLPTRFSYTELNDFQLCPLRYKYAHYLKLPLEGSYHASFGSTIHKTFEEFLKLFKNNFETNQTDLFGNKPSLNPMPEYKILESLYAKNWVDDWYPSKNEKEKYRKVGGKMLETFYENLKISKPKVKHIEKFFKLKLKDYEFRGKIDRIDQTPSGLEIIDYKTGSTPKNKKDIDQLYIYQWAAEDFLNEKVQSLKYWYLKNNEFIIEPTATKEQIADLKNRLLELIEKIIYVTRHDLFKEEHNKAKDHQCQFEDLE